MKRKQILPPTYVFVALLVMLALHFIFPIYKLLPIPWNLIGLIPLIIGIAFNLIANGVFHKAGTTVKPFQESTVLITKSVYSISRHPMYLGFGLILAGVASLLGTLSPWFILPVFAVLMDIVFICVEERMLEDKFGPAWIEYKKKVRRWL
jgi:protein-S-isoprenylcysteine O-methyltransferase Ste14